MNVWYTADLHIGHELVARQRTRGRVLPRYVGAEVDAHDRIVAANWDAMVGRDDHVWVLGDVSAGGTEATAYALNWIASRPGVKHLIPGNHDPVHPMHRDSHRWMSAYRQVFASVQPFARRRIGGRSVLLSHFPYQADHTAVTRFDQYRLRDCGELLMHGHVHSADRLRGREIHVGLDAWELKPVSGREVEELLTFADRIRQLADLCCDLEPWQRHFLEGWYSM